MKLQTTLLAISALNLAAANCGSEPAGMPPPAMPTGLPAVSWPANDPCHPDKVELGRLFFFDKRLSADGTVSCATCHSPYTGYTDGTASAAGVGGQEGNRNSPTVVNAAFLKFLFWDGRAGSLEEQAK